MGDVTVYRIVNRNRRGMYHSNVDGTSLWGESHGGQSDSTHPYPTTDGIHDISDEHRFGFSSPEQLKKWTEFPDVRYLMTKFGGKIHVYKVPERHVLFGGKQVAFKLKYARKINEYPVDHFD